MWRHSLQAIKHAFHDRELAPIEDQGDYLRCPHCGHEGARSEFSYRPHPSEPDLLRRNPTDLVCPTCDWSFPADEGDPFRPQASLKKRADEVFGYRDGRAHVRQYYTMDDLFNNPDAYNVWHNTSLDVDERVGQIASMIEQGQLEKFGSTDMEIKETTWDTPVIDRPAIARTLEAYGASLAMYKSLAKVAYITHRDGEWIVHAESGRVLGKHPSEEKAKAQLKAVEINKHKHKHHKKSSMKKRAYFDTSGLLEEFDRAYSESGLMEGLGNEELGQSAYMYLQEKITQARPIIAKFQADLLARGQDRTSFEDFPSLWIEGSDGWNDAEQGDFTGLESYLDEIIEAGAGYGPMQSDGQGVMSSHKSKTDWRTLLHPLHNSRYTSFVRTIPTDRRTLERVQRHFSRMQGNTDLGNTQWRAVLSDLSFKQAPDGTVKIDISGHPNAPMVQNPITQQPAPLSPEQAQEKNPTVEARRKVGQADRESPIYTFIPDSPDAIGWLIRVIIAGKSQVFFPGGLDDRSAIEAVIARPGVPDAVIQHYLEYENDDPQAFQRAAADRQDFLEYFARGGKEASHRQGAVYQTGEEKFMRMDHLLEATRKEKDSSWRSALGLRKQAIRPKDPYTQAVYDTLYWSYRNVKIKDLQWQNHGVLVEVTNRLKQAGITQQAIEAADDPILNQIEKIYRQVVGDLKGVQTAGLHKKAIGTEPFDQMVQNIVDEIPYVKRFYMEDYGIEITPELLRSHLIEWMLQDTDFAEADVARAIDIAISKIGLSLQSRLRKVALAEGDMVKNIKSGQTGPVIEMEGHGEYTYVHVQLHGNNVGVWPIGEVNLVRTKASTSPTQAPASPPTAAPAAVPVAQALADSKSSDSKKWTILKEGSLELIGQQCAKYAEIHLRHGSETLETVKLERLVTTGKDTVIREWRELINEAVWQEKFAAAKDRLQKEGKLTVAGNVRCISCDIELPENPYPGHSVNCPRCGNKISVRG